MYRLLSLERGKRKRSLELSLAGIYELEMLKKRHETLITRALNDCTSPRHPTHTSWSVMNLLQHQVGELRMDTNSRSVDLSSDAEDTQDSSGLCDQIDVLDSFGLSEISQWAPQLVHLTEGTKSTSNVSGELQAVVPRSLSALEGSCEDEFWSWRSAEDQTSAEDYSQAQRVETYILSLVQRCSVSLRCNKPRTSLGPETRGVVRQSSLSFKDSHYRPDRNKPSPSPERRTWAHHSLDPKPTFAGTSLDFPCAALDPSSSEAESSRHFKGYEPPRSATSDEQLVNGQYIPAQPCHAKTRATSNRPHISPQPAHSTKSPERVPVRSRAAQKKYPFTEEKVTSKKLGRKAFRAQSENSLLGQRVSERKYNTVERDTGRSVQPKTHRTPGVSSQRRWRSTLELSQDEFEPSTDQQIRRTRKPRPALSSCVHSQHSHQSQHAPLSLPEFVACESESSLSAAESPGSSSLSSDSDESGGLVWPQQLAPPSPPAGTSSQPKAFVKIKASHALKKKILRFRTGSLKVMTTV